MDRFGREHMNKYLDIIFSYKTVHSQLVPLNVRVYQKNLNKEENDSFMFSTAVINKVI